MAKELDWDSLEDTLGTDEARREVATLRSTYTDVERRFKEMSKVSAVYALCRLSAEARCHAHVHVQLSNGDVTGRAVKAMLDLLRSLCSRRASTRRCQTVCVLCMPCSAFTAAAAAALVLLEAPVPSAPSQAGILIVLVL